MTGFLATAILFHLLYDMAKDGIKFIDNDASFSLLGRRLAAAVRGEGRRTVRRGRRRT